MKSLICIFALITALDFCVRAELVDVTNGTVVFPAVTHMTNELSTRDLQDVLGIRAYRFKVHRSSATNGLAIYVESCIEGKAPVSVAHMNVDRSVLENQRSGQDVAVFVALNPVAGPEGDGILSAKKLRCFLRGAGVAGTETGDNPFYKSKLSVSTWDDPAHESATTYKLMESNSETNSAAKIELRVRFHEF